MQQPVMICMGQNGIKGETKMERKRKKQQRKKNELALEYKGSLAMGFLLAWAKYLS